MLFGAVLLFVFFVDRIDMSNYVLIFLGFEKFMRTIEEMISVTGSARDGFRNDVTAYMFSKMRKGMT